MSSGNGRFPRPRGSPPTPDSFPPSPQTYSPPPLSTPAHHHLTSPPPTTTSSGEQRAQRAREAVLTGLLRKRFGMRGAEAFVRRHGFEVVNRALSDFDLAEGEGAEIRNPAGFLVWLVGQLEEVSCGDD